MGQPATSALTPEFIHGFVAKCFDHRVPMEKAAAMLEVAELEQRMRNPAFKEGLDAGIRKAVQQRLTTPC